jgi:hypothetical protein
MNGEKIMTLKDFLNVVEDTVEVFNLDGFEEFTQYYDKEYGFHYFKTIEEGLMCEPVLNFKVVRIRKYNNICVYISEE